MRSFCLILAASLALALPAALQAADKKPIPPGKAADQKVALEATVHLDPEEVKTMLGAEPGQGIVVVEVKVTPLHGEKIVLNREDFLLRSDKDGQTSRPMEPTQVAGSSILVVGSKPGEQGRVMSQQRRVPFGVPGIPGTGNGPPATLPSPQPPVVGSATADATTATSTITEDEKLKKNNPLLDTLKKKVLPEGETGEPVTGYLYFLFEGKHKPKHLELVYRKAPPRVHMRFLEPGKK
jgi:hypothetical protein